MTAIRGIGTQAMVAEDPATVTPVVEALASLVEVWISAPSAPEPRPMKLGRLSPQLAHDNAGGEHVWRQHDDGKCECRPEFESRQLRRGDDADQPANQVHRRRQVVGHEKPACQRQSVTYTTAYQRATSRSRP